jgi:hypothetical protein
VKQIKGAEMGYRAFQQTNSSCKAKRGEEVQNRLREISPSDSDFRGGGDDRAQAQAHRASAQTNSRQMERGRLGSSGEVIALVFGFGVLFGLSEAHSEIAVVALEPAARAKAAAAQKRLGAGASEFAVDAKQQGTGQRGREAVQR